MGFAADVAEERRAPGGRCSVPTVLASLPEDVRIDLEDALGDGAISGFAIARALSRRGVVLPGQTIQRHRRGDCRCDVR